MKLIIAIVHDDDANELLKMLVSKDFGVTKLASTGGFLKSGNTTIFMGTDDARVEEAIHIIENTCKTRKQITTTASILGENAMVGLPLEISVGGATVFIVDVENYIKF